MSVTGVALVLGLAGSAVLGISTGPLEILLQRAAALFGAIG